MSGVGPLVGVWGLAAVLTLLDGRRRGVGALAAVGLLAVLGADAVLLARVGESGPLEEVTGGWPAGVGIRLRADTLSALFSLTTTAVLLVALASELLAGVRSRVLPALVAFMAAGLHGAFLTADAFNFYVFFELAMGAAFALASYGQGAAALRAAFSFVVVNLMGSVLFLSGVVGLYQRTGSLDLDQVAGWAASRAGTHPLDVPGALLLSAFGLKLGLFPFHLWAPAVYRNSHPAVAAMLAGALASLGSYGLLRLGVGVLGASLEWARWLVWGLGVASVLYGALLAVARDDVAEVLAYTTIAQAGYVLLALGVGGPGGVLAALLLALVGALDKGALFLAHGQRGPFSGAAFALAALSTVGLPLTAGFIAKAALLGAALSARSVLTLVAVTLAGVLSLLALFRAYQREWWGPPPPHARGSRLAGALLLALAGSVVLAGAWPQPLLVLGGRAVQALTGEAP